MATGTAERKGPEHLSEVARWDEYGAWHLGLEVGATDETTNRYAFGFGDLRHRRSGLIACRYRAAEFDHKQVELAAHELLQLLDDKRS